MSDIPGIAGILGRAGISMGWGEKILKETVTLWRTDKSELSINGGDLLIRLSPKVDKEKSSFSSILFNSFHQRGGKEKTLGFLCVLARGSFPGPSNRLWFNFQLETLAHEYIPAQLAN